MSYVIAAPEMMMAAASDLGGIGSNLDAAHAVAAARTTSVIPAAADEVSAGIAGLFSQFGQDYQALAAEAAAFEEQFEQLLSDGARLYAFIEALAASYLQSAVTFEEGLVSRVAAMPSLLLNPITYLQGLGPIATPIVLIAGSPVLLPLAVIALLIFLWLAEMGAFKGLFGSFPVFGLLA
jgi:hypothetical protein